MQIDIDTTDGTYKALASEFDPASRRDLARLTELMQSGPWLSFVEVSASGVTFQNDMRTVTPTEQITVQPRYDHDEQFSRDNIIKILSTSLTFCLHGDLRWIEDMLKNSAIKLDAGAVFSQESDLVVYGNQTFRSIVDRSPVETARKVGAGTVSKVDRKSMSVR